MDSTPKLKGKELPGGGFELLRVEAGHMTSLGNFATIEELLKRADAELAKAT